MGDQTDLIPEEMRGDVEALTAALERAMQPYIDDMCAFVAGCESASEAIRLDFLPLLRELDCIIRRHETLRAQMRRKGRPGWRHWRGHG